MADRPASPPNYQQFFPDEFVALRYLRLIVVFCNFMVIIAITTNYHFNPNIKKKQEQKNTIIIGRVLLFSAERKEGAAGAVVSYQFRVR